MKKDFDAEQAFNKMFVYMQNMDKRFDAMEYKMDARFKRIDDQYREMYKYMNRRFDDTDKKFERIDGRLDRIVQILDASAGDYKTLVDEHAAEVSAHDRFENTLESHETRIEQLETLDLKKQTA